MRLQLFLAKAGVASRRHSEDLITSGQVTVNGKLVTELGSQIDPNRDQVAVQGKHITAEPLVYLLLNKPKGYVTTTSDPEERPTVFSLLETPYEEPFSDPETKSKTKLPKIPKVRLFSVGRLDYNTEGAIILTNDGLLSNRLMHPRHGIEKIYHAKMKGHLTKEKVQALRDGVVLAPNREYSPTQTVGTAKYKKPYVKPRLERSGKAEVTVLASTSMHTWLEIIIHEGKNRQIHRMADAIGSTLLKLARVKYSFLSVLDMPVGTFRKLQPDEIENLYQMVGMDRSIGHDPKPKIAAKKRFLPAHVEPIQIPRAKHREAQSHKKPESFAQTESQPRTKEKYKSSGTPRRKPDWDAKPSAPRKKPDWDAKPSAPRKKPDWDAKPSAPRKKPDWDAKPSAPRKKPDWDAKPSAPRKKPDWDAKPSAPRKKPDWDAKPSAPKKARSFAFRRKSPMMDS